MMSSLMMLLVYFCHAPLVIDDVFIDDAFVVLLSRSLDH